MDVRQEQTAIKKLKAGDVRGLTALVTAYQHRALRTSYLITQDRALAEDVTQTAFLQAFESIGQFDASRRFLPWFLRIVVNMSVQMAKRQAKIVPLDEPEADAEQALNHLLVSSIPNPESQMEMRQLEGQVQGLLEQLSPDQRAVIVLRYYVDLTENEMADMLKVPQGTVKSRLHAARRRLRRMLTLDPL